MMEKNNVDEIIQRTQRYWSVDGLAEIGFGIFMLLLTLPLLLYILLPHDLTNLALLVLIYVVLVGLGGFGLYRIVDRLKESVTYPRTGYIEYRRPSYLAYPNRPINLLARYILLLALILILVSVLVNIFQNSSSISTRLALFGLVMALPVYFFGISYGPWRFYLVGAFTAVLGLVVGRIVPSESIGILLILGGVGLLTIISGAFTLFHYQRATRSLDDSNPNEP